MNRTQRAVMLNQLNEDTKGEKEVIPHISPKPKEKKPSLIKD